jgi:pimeloyl-ACP methyl ester carboxylesterase
MLSQNFLLSDGRTLEIFTNSAPVSEAIIFHHGTPAHATIWNRWLEYLESKQIFAISYSRAGYGQSSRDLGRSVVDVADDIDQVLEHFGVKSFIAIGASGGGPHALADSTNAKCRGIITLAGVGAYGQPDLEFLAGMGEENNEEFGAAVIGIEALTSWMEANAGGQAQVTGTAIIEAFGGLISQPDKDLLTAEYAEKFATQMRLALSTGYYGWFDDDLAFVRDWGFDLSKISQPVSIWQGDQDFMVPSAHGSWLHSKIEGSELVLQAGEGHLSLNEHCKDEIIETALSMLRRASN